MNKQLIQAFRYAGKSVSKLLMQPVNLIKKGLKKLTNLQIIIATIMRWVNEGIKNITGGKTDSLEDYVRVRRYYVSKKILFFVVLALILFSGLYIKYLQSHVLAFVNRNLTTPVFAVNSPEMADFSGFAKLQYNNGEIIYVGELKDGHVNGEGALYDDQGRLMYRGMFAMDAYSGTGEQYYPASGKTKYKGDFLYNKYEGKGTLYNENGALLYDGGFLNNQYEGAGELYHLTGALKYLGTFSLGEFHGKGILYDEHSNILYDGNFVYGRKTGYGILYQNNIIVYEGEFLDDLYHGVGKEYDAGGNLKYEGSFARSIYEGRGKLYNGDWLYEGEFKGGIKNGVGTLYHGGKTLYTGGFSEGLYNGEGTLYNLERGSIIYKGGFVSGKYEGSGRLYDNEEHLLYEGGFIKGEFSGTGICYDAEGYVVYDGGFRKNMYEGSGRLFEKELLLYEGEFLKGLYNGNGKLYNIVTGFSVFEGKFLNGEYMPNGIEFDDEGKPIEKVSEEPESIPAESYLKMKYSDVLTYLEDNTLRYQQKTIDGAHILIIEKSLLLLFGVDNENKPIAIRSAFICDKTGFMGVFPGMKLSEAEEILGDGIETENLEIAPQHSLALVLSAADSLHIVDRLELNSMRFKTGNGILINVYYYKPEDTQDDLIETGEALAGELPAERYILFIEIR